VCFKTTYLQTQREHFRWENHSDCAPAKQQVYPVWRANIAFLFTKLVLWDSCTQLEASYRHTLRRSVKKLFPKPWKKNM